MDDELIDTDPMNRPTLDMPLIEARLVLASRALVNGDTVIGVSPRKSEASVIPVYLFAIPEAEAKRLYKAMGEMFREANQDQH